MEDMSPYEFYPRRLLMVVGACWLLENQDLGCKISINYKHWVFFNMISKNIWVPTL